MHDPEPLRLAWRRVPHAMAAYDTTRGDRIWQDTYGPAWTVRRADGQERRCYTTAEAVRFAEALPPVSSPRAWPGDGILQPFRDRP